MRPPPLTLARASLPRAQLTPPSLARRWQGWKAHIGYNFREGIVLSTVQYFDRDEQRYRPIFYRTSFAEMVVPYGAPEWPHPRKFAFDVGEYGLGMMANSLELGCDCKGSIHYLDSELSNHDGKPVTLKNVVCIHEEDDGLLWKVRAPPSSLGPLERVRQLTLLLSPSQHTDFRPGGRAHSVRSRKLIIQMICTVANYEYAVRSRPRSQLSSSSAARTSRASLTSSSSSLSAQFAFEFKQDGSFGCNVKLTGILNTYTAAENEKTPFGVLVGPGVQAHHHQHIFSLRVDPMIECVHLLCPSTFRASRTRERPVADDDLSLRTHPLSSSRFLVPLPLSFSLAAASRTRSTSRRSTSSMHQRARLRTGCVARPPPPRQLEKVGS